MRTISVIGAILLGLGCQREASAPVMVPKPVVKEVTPAPPDAGLMLTDAKVLAFIAYQEAALAAQGANADPKDAGSQDKVALLIERAQRDERALASAGLTAGELDFLEEMVASLAQKRWLSKGVGTDALNDKLQEWAADASEAHKKLVAEAVEPLKVPGSGELREERQRFGDANVTTLLAHEPRLFELWQRLMKK